MPAADAQRDKFFPADLKEGDKYIYTATQFDNRAAGWSSTKDLLGFWLVNQSFGMSVPQTLRSWTVMKVITSIVGILIVLGVQSVFG